MRSPMADLQCGGRQVLRMQDFSGIWDFNMQGLFRSGIHNCRSLHEMHGHNFSNLYSGLQGNKR